jgi:hypothetical protein
MQAGRALMMSTNSWWFSPRAIVDRLSTSSGLLANDVRRLLRTSPAADVATEIAGVFDASFPVLPITTRCTANGTAALQLERDLDQIALLGPHLVAAVRVQEERAVSIKLADDLEDVAKTRFL